MEIPYGFCLLKAGSGMDLIFFCFNALKEELVVLGSVRIHPEVIKSFPKRNNSFGCHIKPNFKFTGETW